MQTTVVSIAMCTFNGEAFIEDQLNSILHQTYNNIEIIISDDQSSDRTVEIIKAYQKKDSRIKLYENKVNLGFLKNFEKVISLCKGEYIALADQDDIWKEYKIEKFLKHIGEHILIYSDAIIIDKESKETGTELIRPHNVLCKGACNKSLLLYNVVSGNTMMFHKKLVPYILPIHQNMTYHDSWIAFIAATHSSITYTDEAMIYYRRYPEQVTHTIRTKEHNVFRKIKIKMQKQITNAKLREQELIAFKSVKLMKDKETLILIETLILHFKNFKKIFFNYTLYKLLKKYLHEVFATLPSIKHNKMARRVAKGLKIHLYSLYLL